MTQREPYNAPAVREALRKLPLRFIRRAMPAFDHPPRGNYVPVCGDACGCWVTTATYGCKGIDEIPDHVYEVVQRFVGRFGETSLSDAYECSPDWFRSECIREIAERGRSKRGAKIAAAKT